ncbi:MAG: T9SS type A sorting domain-containing protein, partial [Caldithrix sp.]|nr:T9SS type A sorting domain-containing protein [Caldithrix sp.]
SLFNVNYDTMRTVRYDTVITWNYDTVRTDTAYTMFEDDTMYTVMTDTMYYDTTFIQHGYDATSLYSFGNIHGEGPGIAGWGGSQLKWTQEIFDLSAYTSSDTAVKIRFDFAADLGFATPDDPSMFGWQIDNIEIKSESMTYFSNYGEDQDLMAMSFGRASGGSQWHVAEIQNPLPAFGPSFVPSPTHSATVQTGGEFYDPDTTYNRWLDNVYYTDEVISLPDTTPIYMDFKMLPDFADPDAFPEVDFYWPVIRPVDSTAWEAVWITPEGTYYVFSFGFDQWIEFAWLYEGVFNSSPLILDRFKGQDVQVGIRFASDGDAPIGSGLLVDDMVVFSPIKDIAAPENLVATPSPQDTSVVLTWDYADSISHYFVFRQGPGDAAPFNIGVAQDSGVYRDKGENVKYYRDYLYFVLAGAEYEGVSGASNAVSTTIYPDGIGEFGFNDGERDDYLPLDQQKFVAVKFTPEAYPITFQTIKVNLDTSEIIGVAGKFSVFDTDEFGRPNEEIEFTFASGLADGNNIVEFRNPVTIDSGRSFFVGYSRFLTSPYMGVDKDDPIDGNTYIETDYGWVTSVELDAMINVFMDTSETIDPTAITENESAIPDKFVLKDNYPNPFNPITTIEFNVPKKAVGSDVSLAVYNVLGQKVATLFDQQTKAGWHKVNWNGQNDFGTQVSSGFYIYQLRGKGITINKRMLLIK